MNPSEVHVLTIDDSENARKELRGKLNSLGFSKVVEAINGLHAIELLAVARANNQRIDVIISDWNMPYISGLEFVMMIRTIDLWQKIPIIFLTSNTKVEEVVRAAAMGIKNYVVKPVNTETLKAKLESLLK